MLGDLPVDKGAENLGRLVRQGVQNPWSLLDEVYGKYNADEVDAVV